MPRRPNRNIQNISADELDDLYYGPEGYIGDDPPLSSERSRQIIDANHQRMYPTPEMQADYEARRAYRGPPLSREERRANARWRKRKRREYHQGLAEMAVPDELPIDDIMTERAGLLPTSSRAARIGAMGRRAVRALPVVGAAAEAAVTANNIRNEGLSRGLQRTGADTIDAAAGLAGGLGRVYWPAQLAEAGLRGLTGAYHRREEREARQELTDEELEALLLERSR